LTKHIADFPSTFFIYTYCSPYFRGCIPVMRSTGLGLHEARLMRGFLIACLHWQISRSCNNDCLTGKPLPALSPDEQ
jgi:hypothetical protein